MPRERTRNGSRGTPGWTESPEDEKSLKTDDLTVGCTDEKETEGNPDIVGPIYDNSVRIDPITEFTVVAVFILLVVLSRIVPGISCRLRTKVTQRIRDGTMFGIEKINF